MGGTHRLPALPAVVQQSVKGAVDGLPLWLLHRFGVGRVRWRTAVAATMVSVVGVGVTRVWLGVHWPSDVLGGRLFGALVVAPAVIGYEWPWPGHAGTAGHRG